MTIAIVRGRDLDVSNALVLHKWEMTVVRKRLFEAVGPKVDWVSGLRVRTVLSLHSLVR